MLEFVAYPVHALDDGAARKQVELLREAGTARRFERARSLSASVIGLARRAIRARHPALSESDVLLRFAEVHYGPELASRIALYLARRR